MQLNDVRMNIHHNEKKIILCYYYAYIYKRIYKFYINCSPSCRKSAYIKP